MARAVLVLAYPVDRAKAHAWIDRAPVNTRVELKAPKRSVPQSDRMWAHLTDIAGQRDWHGVKLSTEDWKILFMSALKQEMRLVPNLDGTGFVQLGRSSSDLGRDEMADLITLIEAWAAREGVTLKDPKVSSLEAPAATAVGAGAAA